MLLARTLLRPTSTAAVQRILSAFNEKKIKKIIN